jgi:hypothetical protein
MTPDWHDLVVRYAEARRDAGLLPWKVSSLFRQAVDEFMARNPVPDARVAQSVEQPRKASSAEASPSSETTQAPGPEQSRPVSGSNPLPSVAPEMIDLDPLMHD